MALRTGQKLLVLMLSLLVATALPSCGKRGGDPLEYRTRRFFAEMSGRIVPSDGEKLDFSAEIEYFDRINGESRKFRLTFRSPAALSGLTVCRDSDGGVTVSLDGIGQTLPNGDAVSGFIKIAEMLDPSEDILEVSSISGDLVGIGGIPYLTLVKTRSCAIYLDPHSAFPVKAEISDGEIGIFADCVNCRT